MEKFCERQDTATAFHIHGTRALFEIPHIYAKLKCWRGIERICKAVGSGLGSECQGEEAGVQEGMRIGNLRYAWVRAGEVLRQMTKAESCYTKTEHTLMEKHGIFIGYITSLSNTKPLFMFWKVMF